MCAAAGDRGLCTAASVARGYRNLPEQAAKTFIRSVSGSPDRGQMMMIRRCTFPRPDARLKVRGHRVEARAVEISADSVQRDRRRSRLPA